MFKVEDKDYKNLKGLKFIDLFAGIGGFHLALTSFKTECVFVSEWDKNAQDVYKKNFNLEVYGDITKINESEIPQHDIICGGFPCQAFSISGKQKGFNDTRGTLFFDIARIANYHKPKILFLENVFNFEKHDKGRTLKKVLETLDDIGYQTYYKVLNASHFGIPQTRKRIYFVCFRKDLQINNFKFPEPKFENIKLIDFLEKLKDNSQYVIPETKLKKLILKDHSNLNTKNLFDQNDGKSIRLGSVNGGGQGNRIYSPMGNAITLSAYGGGTGSKTGLYYINGEIRKLTPRECANISGFPNSFILSEKKNDSYKQFGNSVVVDVLQHILIQINKVLI